MAKQSLAAQSGALKDTFKLPAVFQEPTTPMAPRSFSPYISFAHPNKKDEWKKLTDKFQNVSEGQMFLVETDVITPLLVAKLGWIAHFQYWAMSNAAGETTQSSLTEMPFPWKEMVEAVVLVYLDDRCTVANTTFKTTKCPAAHDLSTALAECQTPEWLEKSPAHAETGVVTQPFGRFFGEVSLAPTRTSKKSGMPYTPTQCNIKPTTLTEWRLFKAFSEHADTQKAMDAAGNNYKSRIDSAKAKLLK
jgi:hypothetical protein